MRTLEGDRVVDPRGELVGTIEELIVDVRRGVLAYALIARRPDRVLHRVPWTALKFDAATDALVLAEPLSHFEGAAAAVGI